MTLDERSRRYVELGLQWAAGHPNRMIKVPATEAGLLALEDLAAAGITLNVTLIFTMDQYLQARDAVWRGAQRRASLDTFKSVYSIFVSRIDLYTDEEVPTLSAAAQGQVGIVNAKRIWDANRRFWEAHPTPLQQEIIFASTGTKKPTDAPWKYVQALAGSDIQTNPPQTNQAVADSQQSFRATLADPISDALWAEIQAKINFANMQRTLMAQGVDKFIKPQRALLALLDQRRESLVGSK
jgi:transaldolase